VCIKWINIYLMHTFQKHTKSIKEFIYKNIREIKGKRKKRKSWYCTRLEGLTLSKQSPVELPTIATYPSAGGWCEGSRVRLPRKENARSRHQSLFEENVGKTEKVCGLWTLIVKGSGVVFMHGEGISTPRVHYKGRQPLIECARHDFKIIYFSFFMFFFLHFYAFYVFYLFVDDKGVSLAPTYPQLRWGNQTYVVLLELNVG